MTTVPETGRLSLPAVSDGVAAGGLRESLAMLASRGGSVEVEGSAVERIGTPSLQILVAARRSMMARGLSLAVIRRSPVLCKAIEDLGLAAEIGDDEITQGGVVNG